MQRQGCTVIMTAKTIGRLSRLRLDIGCIEEHGTNHDQHQTSQQTRPDKICAPYTAIGHLLHTTYPHFVLIQAVVPYLKSTHSQNPQTTILYYFSQQPLKH
jgi:hypothetical protein